MVYRRGGGVVSGQTVLCVICRVTIEYDYRLQAWFDFHQFSKSKVPYEHSHQPRDGRK